MTVSELSVRRPVTITMIYVLICVIACMFIHRLGVALFPSTTRPMLSIFTSYPNVGPEEIDINVTSVIVNRLSRVSDVKTISTRSYNGSSRITLQFGYDKDLEEAYDDVTAALSNISNMVAAFLPL